MRRVFRGKANVRHCHMNGTCCRQNNAEPHQFLRKLEHLAYRQALHGLPSCGMRGVGVGVVAKGGSTAGARTDAAHSTKAQLAAAAQKAYGAHGKRLRAQPRAVRTIRLGHLEGGADEAPIKGILVCCVEARLCLSPSNLIACLRTPPAGSIKNTIAANDANDARMSESGEPHLPPRRDGLGMYGGVAGELCQFPKHFLTFDQSQNAEKNALCRRLMDARGANS